MFCLYFCPALKIRETEAITTVEELSTQLYYLLHKRQTISNMVIIDVKYILFDHFRNWLQFSLFALEWCFTIRDNTGHNMILFTVKTWDYVERYTDLKDQEISRSSVWYQEMLSDPRIAFATGNVGTMSNNSDHLLCCWMSINEIIK